MSASFENLDVWKAGCRISVSVIKEMSSCKIFGLRDQMIRSAISKMLQGLSSSLKINIDNQKR